MDTIFTKIYRGEIPAFFVAKTEEFFAFMDINPLKIGHVLVVPVQEVDYVFDLDPEYLSRYMVFAQRIAKAIKEAVECERIGMAVIGLEVPHAHIHLVPINDLGDINFSQKKLTPTKEELQTLAESIAARLV